MAHCGDNTKYIKIPFCCPVKCERILFLKGDAIISKERTAIKALL
jgi:hypothetical protein